MVFFNYSTMQMAAKVVYYGPGLCGKTTNLQYIYGHTSGDSRGEMVSLETETDRTLFFDLLPIDVGTIGGFSTRIQLYTVPGQVFYNTTRKLVLKGVDGVVFVADSQKPMLQANVDSFNNLEENLAEMGIALRELPLVLQYNKRDLPSICTIEEMNEALNTGGWQYFEASALNGQGVFETLKGISKLTLMALKQKLGRQDEVKPAPRPPVAPKPAAPAAPKPSAPAAAAAPPAAKPAPTAPTAPAPAARATPAPAAPAPPKAPAQAPPQAPGARGGSRGVDVLGELEKLRQQTQGPARRLRGRGGNGHGELSREIQLTLKRDDFQRLRRFTVTLQVEDENQQVVESVRDFHVDIQDPKSLQKVLLKLNIALNSKG
jgi:signal recognition particle receptor subunit beta